MTGCARESREHSQDVPPPNHPAHLQQVAAIGATSCCSAHNAHDRALCSGLWAAHLCFSAPITPLLCKQPGTEQSELLLCIKARDISLYKNE